MNTQLKKDDVILLTIKRLGINGEGIGFYKRQVVFVPNALVGEVVEVKIVEANEKYVYGEITKIKEKSKDRIEPLCPYFGKCGGCQLQHLVYHAQLKEKKDLVIEAFNRYYDGDVSKIKFYDTIPMKRNGELSPFAYRNKSSLPLRHDGEKVVAGMYAINSNKLVYIDNCVIENDTINKVRKDILHVLSKANVSIYNPKTGMGSLRYLVIRAFPNSDEVQVTFVLTKEDNKIINVLKSLKYASLNYNINSDKDSIEIFTGDVINVGGKKEIKGMLDTLSFAISPQAFFQLNTIQTVHLYEEIRKACDLKGTENVLDCYCGIGSIGMYLSKYAKSIRGIDVNSEGIDNANNFVLENDVKNAKFYKGNILPHLHQFEKEGYNIDVLIVDPPRKGLDLNLINYLQKSRIPKIVYVSCNPATLAKNINHLQKSYHIEYVQPFDMFPETSHVESVCLLMNRAGNISKK